MRVLKQTLLKNRTRFRILWWILAVSILAVDVFVPLGVADGMLYVALILTGLLAGDRKVILHGAILGTLFTVAGFVLSPPGVELWKAVVNRGLSIATLWITAALCQLQNRAQSALEAVQVQLEQRVMERTTQLDHANLLLKQESAYVQLHKDIAVASNETRAVEDTLLYCLKRICNHAQWPVGHVYLVGPGSKPQLVSTNIWHMDHPEQFEVFRSISEATDFDSGIGLPGRVLSSGKPAWIMDVTQDSNFPRAQGVLDLNVRAGFAFPILIGRQVVAIMEFFSTEAEAPKTEMLEVMSHIGAQLGRVMERQRAEREQDQLLDFLRKKVNEQTCQYNVARLITHSGTLQEIFPKLESQIAPALQFPDRVRVRIRFDGNVFASKDFEETPWRLSTPITIQGSERGVLEVFYIENCPTFDIGPFRHEEHRLIEALGNLLSLAAERKTAEEEIERSQVQLRNLYHRLNHVREEERTRIAREIHDELAQVLTALRLEMDVLNKKLDREISFHQSDTRRMLDLIDQSIPTVKNLILDLRPPMLDDLGLIEAIQWQAQEFEKKTGIACNIVLRAREVHLGKDPATAIFRIFQETLTNVVRHAQASRVEVVLDQQGGNLILNVRDDGVGIQPESISHGASLGLLGMRERARMWGGEVNVQGSPGGGTTVKIILPRSKE